MLQAMDGSQASFEHAMGHTLEFATPRHRGVIAMNPEPYERLPQGEGGAGLPEGQAWLFVERDGDDLDSVDAGADRLLDRLAENAGVYAGRGPTDVEEYPAKWDTCKDWWRFCTYSSGAAGHRTPSDLAGDAT